MVDESDGVSSKNPYAPGSSPSVVQPLDLNDASQRCLMALIGTRPWVRFVGILTAILAALCALVGIVAAFATVTGDRAALLIAGIYLALATLWGFAAKFLLFYAGSITRAQASLKLDDIAGALEHQKGFWKLIGISTACILVLWLVALLLGSVLSAFYRIGLFN
jgi:hypothetical protein